MDGNTREIVSIITAETQAHFFQLMRIRATVFMDEQAVDPLLELDEEDDTGIHLIAYSGKVPVGTCRVLLHDTYAKIGRLAVLPTHRKKGIATALLLNAEILSEVKNFYYLVLNAQIAALPLYIKNGYVANGEHFFEANIEHVKMTKKLR